MIPMLVPMNTPGALKVVYRSPRCVVVEKPAGLLSVPGKARGGADNQDCAAARVRAMFPQSTGPLVVHRLDMDTSGLLLFGLDPEAQRELSMQFEARRVDKRYIALVEGVPPAERGEIDAPMRADIENRPVQIIDDAHGKPSRTRWSLLTVEGDRSRLLLEPLTGRTHQLRVHLAHIGHPILGDVLYGPRGETASAVERLMLHASKLEFDEPGGAAVGGGGRIRVASTPEF